MNDDSELRHIALMISFESIGIVIDIDGFIQKIVWLKR